MNKGMIWSKKAIDYSKGIFKSPNGQNVPRKMGTLVVNLKAANEWQVEWANKEQLFYQKALSESNKPISESITDSQQEISGEGSC